MQVTATWSTPYHAVGFPHVWYISRPALCCDLRPSLVLMTAKGPPSGRWSKGNKVAHCVSCDGAGSTGRIRDLRLNHQMEQEKGRGFPLGGLAKAPPPPTRQPTQPRSMFLGQL